MLVSLADNIYMYVVFGDQIFKKIVGISIGTKFAPSLAEVFLYSYETAFFQHLQDNNKSTANGTKSLKKL
jgi:hypothetical protein